jgi:hypothetical protein
MERNEEEQTKVWDESNMSKVWDEKNKSRQKYRMKRI